MRTLITGGAGFIGSSLAEHLIQLGHEVRVLDDLSTGYRENVPEDATLIEGDIADARAVARAVDGIEQVFHQAAHRAVLRSVNDPVATDRANTHATVMLLKASVNAGVQRFIYASSSSVYGGAAVLPTPESAPLRPRSPYAVSKLAAEHYCRVFSDLYEIETVSLRYFNVYGPRQRPDSAYAAVVPLFIEAVRTGEAPLIHGDGHQSRSFTFIDDVVAANLAASNAPGEACRGQAYNIAGETTHTVLDVLTAIKSLFGSSVAPVHTDPRMGDVRHTWADPSAAAAALGYRAELGLEEGLEKTVAWFLARTLPTSP